MNSLSQYLVLLRKFVEVIKGLKIMDYFFAILPFAILAFIVGCIYGEKRAQTQSSLKEQQKKEETEKQLEQTKQHNQIIKENKKQDILNIKKALQKLSLRSSVHHCEGVYSMLKSKYCFISENETLEKQIYDLLIKEPKHKQENKKESEE